MLCPQSCVLLLVMPCPAFQSCYLKYSCISRSWTNIFILWCLQVIYWASLIAQLVKNPPAVQETLVQFLGRKIPWRRGRLPTPIFLGFPCGSGGKKSACNAQDLGSIPGLGRSPGEGKGYRIQYSGPREFQGLHSPWGHKELDLTEQLTLLIGTFYFQGLNQFDLTIYLVKLFLTIQSIDKKSWEG